MKWMCIEELETFVTPWSPKLELKVVWFLMWELVRLSRTPCRAAHTSTGDRRSINLCVQRTVVIVLKLDSAAMEFGRIFEAWLYEHFPLSDIASPNAWYNQVKAHLTWRLNLNRMHSFTSTSRFWLRKCQVNLTLLYMRMSCLSYCA